MARIVKCENCETGGILLEGGNAGCRWKYLTGWTTVMRSTKFPEQKRAYWCPDCFRAKDIACLKYWLPDVPDDVIEILLDQAELEKLREN